MNQTIRIGKNGCGSEVDFRGKKVYFHCDRGKEVYLSYLTIKKQFF